MFRLLDKVLKGYLVLRVRLLLRKDERINSIKLVRQHYGHKRLMYGSPMYGDPPGSLSALPNARDFVLAIDEEGYVPETF